VFSVLDKGTVSVPDKDVVFRIIPEEKSIGLSFSEIKVND
jgi:hypothetical protein